MLHRWLQRMRRRRGTGLIVVLVLVVVMSVYVVADGVALRSLHKRLTLIERRHQRRWQQVSKPRPGH